MGRLRDWLMPPQRREQSAVALRVEEPKPVVSDEIDPDLAQLQRSLAAADAEPVGGSDEPLTPLAVGVIVKWMETAYEAGELSSIWECRVRYGYGVGRGEASREQWFWFNAYPALAALRLGKRDHPFVATCCGLADQVCDRTNERQANAQDEVEQLFFG